MQFYNRSFFWHGLFIIGLLLGVISPSMATDNEGISVNYDESKQALNIKHCFTRAPDYIETKDNQIKQLTTAMS